MAGQVTGSLESINVSDGGVPKRSRLEASVEIDGVAGDRQRNLKYHGGPERAVSLFASELIERIHAEGHPIAPGSTGENLTVRGVEWSLVVPGRNVGVGTELVLMITSFVVPCRTIQASFLDGRISRISQKINPGWSRVYAKVVRAGIVRIGDEVVLLDS